MHRVKKGSKKKISTISFIHKSIFITSTFEMSLVPTNVLISPHSTAQTHLPLFSYPRRQNVQIPVPVTISPYFQHQFGPPSYTNLNHPSVDELVQYSKPINYFHGYPSQDTTTHSPYLHSQIGSHSGYKNDHKKELSPTPRKDWSTNHNHQKLRKKGDPFIHSAR